MDCVVLKCGGTSVQDAAALMRLVGTVAAEPRRRVRLQLHDTFFDAVHA